MSLHLRRRSATRLLAVALVVAAVVGTVAWLIDAGRNREADREKAAIQRMMAAVASTETGHRVDLAIALDLPWDRAVLMEAYSDGAAMNERLGFDWYDADAMSAADESHQFVVFVAGMTVAADTVLFNEGFQFDETITSFTRSESQFIVVRDSGDEVLTRP